MVWSFFFKGNRHQKAVRDSLMTIESVTTLLNVSDLGTTRLSRQRRHVLMFLMGMVRFNEDIMEYEAVGEQEFTEHTQRRAMGKNMKVVRQVMMQTLANGVDGIQPRVSMPRVKSILLLAFQPVASASQTEEVEYKEVLAKGYLEFFFQNYEYMLVIALAFLMAGFILGLQFMLMWR